MKIKNDEEKRRRKCAVAGESGKGQVGSAVWGGGQYSLFIGHFVTIAFRVSLLDARARPAFTVSCRSRRFSYRFVSHLTSNSLYGTFYVFMA